MTTKPVPVYWDTCVYIACIQREPTRYPVLRHILDEAEAGRVVLVASSLVIAEVTHLRASTEPLEKQADRIREFFENPFIEVRNVTRQIAEDAARISHNHKLKPPDAIHVATALQTRCSCLQTYDGDKRPAGAKRTFLLDVDGQIGHPPLKIEIPTRLFDETKPLL